MQEHAGHWEAYVVYYRMAGLFKYQLNQPMMANKCCNIFIHLITYQDLKKKFVSLKSNFANQ